MSMRRSRSRSKSRAPEDHSRIEAFEPMLPLHSQQRLEATRDGLKVKRAFGALAPSSNQQYTPLQRNMNQSQGKWAAQPPTDPRLSAHRPMQPNGQVSRASDTGMGSTQQRRPSDSNQRRPSDSTFGRYVAPPMQANNSRWPLNRSNPTPNVTPNYRQNNGPPMAEHRLGHHRNINWSHQRPIDPHNSVQARPNEQQGITSNALSMRQLSGEQPQQVRRLVNEPSQRQSDFEEEDVLPNTLLPEYNSNENVNTGNNGGGSFSSSLEQPLNASHGANTPRTHYHQQSQRRHHSAVGVQRRVIQSSDDDDEGEDDDGDNSATYAKPTLKRGRLDLNNHDINTSNLFAGPTTSAAAAGTAIDNELTSNSTGNSWLEEQQALATDIRAHFTACNKKKELCGEFLKQFSSVIQPVSDMLNSHRHRQQGGQR